MKKQLTVFFALTLSTIACPFTYADDGAAGFEWASAREVYDKAECYTESGGYLRNSKAFTDGCLEYLGAEPSSSEEDPPKTDELASTDEAPTQDMDPRLSNDAFIQDNW